MNNYINARIYVNEFENGMPVDAPIALRLVGENLDSIKLYSDKIEDIIRENEGTIYVKNPLNQSLTDIRVVINREKAGILGVPTVEIDRTIRLGLAGIIAGKYHDKGGKEYSINVRIPRQKVNTLVLRQYLRGLPVRSANSSFTACKNRIRKFADTNTTL